MLGQPGDEFFEVARVVRARARPRDRFQSHTAVAAAQPAQLARDDAAARAQVQVPRALHAPVMDLQVTAGLTAVRANPSAGAAGGRSRSPVDTEADANHGCPGQAEQPLECALTEEFHKGPIAPERREEGVRLARALGREGHEVSEAGDGRVALEGVLETPPALIIPDIGLPGIDGVEVCRGVFRM